MPRPIFNIWSWLFICEADKKQERITRTITVCDDNAL